MKQQSKEWFKARELMFTASNALTIATNGLGLEKYVEHLIELANGKETFQGNFWTRRGNQLEPHARSQYEWETGQVVEEEGFATNHKYPKAGCSVDGLVNDNGLIEVKCYAEKKFREIQFKEKIPKQCYYQMQFQLMIKERKWNDGVFYFPDEKLVIIRVFPDKKVFAEILLGLKSGRRILKSKLKK